MGKRKVGNKEKGKQIGIESGTILGRRRMFLKRNNGAKASFLGGKTSLSPA